MLRGSKKGSRADNASVEVDPESDAPLSRDERSSEMLDTTEDAISVGEVIENVDDDSIGLVNVKELVSIGAEKE